MLSSLISFVVTVHVCAAEHGQRIVKWKNKWGVIDDNIQTHPPAPNAIKVMEKVRTKIMRAPLHPVGAGCLMPVGSVLVELGTHLKSIFLSPFFSSKYPSWHWKLHSVLSSILLVFGSLMEWIRTSLVDCGVPLLHPPASILRLLIVSSFIVHVWAAKHGRKIAKWKKRSDESYYCSTHLVAPYTCKWHARNNAVI